MGMERGCVLRRHGTLRQPGQQQCDKGGDSGGAGVEERPWRKLGHREGIIMALAVAETTLAHAVGSGDDAPGSGSGASWGSVCGLLVGP